MADPWSIDPMDQIQIRCEYPHGNGVYIPMYCHYIPIIYLLKGLHPMISSIYIPQISYFHINSHIIPRFSPHVMGPRGYKALPISLRIDILHRTILVVLSVKLSSAMVGVRTAMLYIVIKPSTIET